MKLNNLEPKKLIYKKKYSKKILNKNINKNKMIIKIKIKNKERQEKEKAKIQKKPQL